MKAFKSLVATSLLMVAGAVLMYGIWMMLINPSLSKAEVFYIVTGAALVLYFTADFAFSQTEKENVRTEPQFEEDSSEASPLEYRKDNPTIGDELGVVIPPKAAEDQDQFVAKRTASASKPAKPQATRTGPRQPKTKAYIVKQPPKADVPEELYTVPAFVRRERTLAQAKAARSARAKPASNRKQPLVSKDVYDSSLSEMFGSAVH